MQQERCYCNIIKKVVHDDFNNWSNTLLDSLDDLYDLENKLLDEFKNRITLTQREFDNILTDILRETKAIELITVPGFYEIVAEEFNNEVLTRWRKKQCLPTTQ